ncbi:MAG: sulfatase-like hydrolase/transferase, partial [Planctomycetota bacterium]
MSRLISLAAVLPIFLLSVEPAAAEPPNIVLIISDDQAWSDYGFMGHEVIETPHLDRLASEATVFPRGYVPTALCRPSLATLLTGQYASVHGITGNDPSPKYAERESKLYAERRAQLISYMDRFPLLPKALADAGYMTHQSGKLWEGSYQNAGFTHGMTRGFPERGGRHGDDGLKIGREGMGPIDAFLDEAIDKEKPFFLWYAPFMPHTPHTPPQRLLDKYTKDGRSQTIAKYYAMCEWFDETCGQLRTSLEQRNVHENTLIVYVCDNGWIQDPDSRKYAPRSKQTPYEGGIRTPIFYWMPGKIPAARRDELETSLDIYPTILAAAGIDVPDGLPGMNLMESLTKKQPIDRERIFGESFAHDIADIENPEASLLFRWCIEGQWKLLLT